MSVASLGNTFSKICPKATSILLATSARLLLSTLSSQTKGSLVIGLIIFISNPSLVLPPLTRMSVIASVNNASSTNGLKKNSKPSIVCPIIFLSTVSMLSVGSVIKFKMFLKLSVTGAEGSVYVKSIYCMFPLLSLLNNKALFFDHGARFKSLTAFSSSSEIPKANLLKSVNPFENKYVVVT